MGSSTLRRAVWLIAVASLIMTGDRASQCRAADATDTMEERRAQIEQLSPAARDDLRRNFEKFERLSPSDQRRLRALDAAVDADPQLRRVLVEYHEWLETLDAGERAELLALPTEERVKWIKQQQARESKSKAMRQANQTRSWVYGYVDRHRTQLMADPAVKKALASDNRPAGQQDQVITRLLMARWKGEPKAQAAALDSADLAAWGEILEDSPKWLYARMTPDDQRNEIRRQMQSLAKRYRGGRRDVTDDELARYLRTLPTAEQERVMAMPTEVERMSELRRKFIEANPHRKGRGHGIRNGKSADAKSKQTPPTDKKPITNQVPASTVEPVKPASSGQLPGGKP